MLKNILVSEVRVKILGMLLLNPNESYHVRAIVRHVGAEINAVRRELENLTEIGLLTRRQSSNRIYYTAVTEHPFYTDLLALCSKNEGIGNQLLTQVTKMGDIQFLVLSKAFIRGRASSPLDIDLFVVGTLVGGVLETIIENFEKTSGREINFSVMNEDEFKNRKRTGDPFILRVMGQSRIVLCGDEEKFCSIM